jgi:hypothetical protein
MALTDSQYAQLIQILTNGKLFSELIEQTSLTDDSFFAAINTGTDDAKKIKIPLLRGFNGDWNASTNTPTLVNGTGLKGSVYRVSVAGTRDLGNGSVSFLVDDIIYYNGSKWVKLTQTQITDIVGLQSQLDSKVGIGLLSDSFYMDEGVLYSNLSNYRQSIDFTSGSQTFTLDFEPTFFIGIFVNGQYLDDDDYIYTSPDQLEILGTLESGDKIKIIYEHFNQPPVIPE